MKRRRATAAEPDVIPAEGGVPEAVAGHGAKNMRSDARRTHRVACHRCGNLRSYTVLCAACPQTFCRMCAKKMVDEHGDKAFAGGCPKCKGLCCCRTRSMHCTRLNHCYKKCPTTKVLGRDSGPARAKRKGRSPLLRRKQSKPAHVDFITLYAQLEEFLVHSHEYTYPPGWGSVEEEEVATAIEAV